MDILVLILLVVFSSAFSGSKKAKQDREKRINEQPQQARPIPKEFSQPVREVQKTKQMPKEQVRPIEQEKRKVAPSNASKQARPAQKKAMNHTKPIQQERPMKKEVVKEEKRPTLAQHERKPVVHSTLTQDRHEKKSPYGQVACNHAENAHLKADLKPNKSPLQVEQTHQKRNVAAIQVETFELGMSRKEIVSGIVWGEVLNKPRAYDSRRYGRR